MHWPDPYKPVVRPLAFRLPAERAHDMGKSLYRRAAIWERLGPLFRVDSPRLRARLGPLELANPVGLAAGFDKDVEMVRVMSALGFGYTIPGSIRPVVAGDNPSPKIIRYADRDSLVNCTGLPSKGARRAAHRLGQLPRQLPGGTKVIPSIQGFSIDDYIACLELVQPWADAIEIPLHCPNERYEGIDFLHVPTVRSLLRELTARKERPFLVKIRNYHDPRERANRLELVEACLEAGVNGITLPGSMTVPEPRLSQGKGNLTGRLVLGNTLRNIRDVYRATDGSVAIKALGGISTAADAFEAIAAGANTIELLTGLVYEGWSVAANINRGLLRLLDRAGVPDVAQLRGVKLDEPAEA